MRIAKWSAVAVTGLFVLMNLGAALEPDAQPWARIAGVVLGVLGIVAAGALATGRSWGSAAVITVGLLNMLAAVAGIILDLEGGEIGLVVGGLGAVLGFMAGRSTPSSVAVTGSSH